jgi:chromosome segregation protein
VFLKSIDIYGFKTFAEKTSLQFRPGVTAIVGPNGCGKSNIVDAIRWVLGESNARSLRGEVMEDVIFSGSDEQKPLGMAEVSLTIVNDDALLPIEYSEVTVKRRLYRSGESEFFINKNPVRLRDIHELFADTGIGKPAYSIMEQGNIDVLLSNKPEERMLIFEEAAGITRYKMRIRESYRKLSATDENLLRLNLIIREVEKEYRNLGKQAEKAHAYRALKKDEIEYETLYNYERIRKLKEKVAKNSDQLKRLSDEKVQLDEKTSSLNETIRNDIERVRGIEADIMEIRNEVYRKEAALETIESKISHIGERIQEVEGEVAKKKRAIQESKKRKSALENRVAELERDRGRLNDLVKSQEDKLAGYVSEVEHLSEIIRKNGEQIGRNNAVLAKIEVSLSSLRDELSEVVDRLLHEIDEVKTRYSSNEHRKSDTIERIHESIEKAESVLKFHGSKLQDLEFAVSDRGFKPLVTELREEIGSLRGMMARLRDDIDTVIDMQDDLSRVLFGKESPHSKKEQIENRINSLLKNQSDLKKENHLLDEENRNSGEKKEQFEEIINGLRPEIAANRVQEEHCSENIDRLESELQRSEEYLQDAEFEIRSLAERKESFQTDIDNLSDEYAGIDGEKLLLSEKIREQNSIIDRIVGDIQENEEEVEKKNHRVAILIGSMESLEIRNAEHNSRMDTIYESFRERYSKSLELFKPVGSVDLNRINEKRVTIRNEIAALGQVNPMAIEEFEEVKKRYDYLSDQKSDMEKAREDLNQIVSETLNTSKELFMESLDRIQNNFNSIFRRLFNGGKTDLYLTNEANIFDTGIEILAYPPGKSPKRRSLLSGGEKSLTAIALLFSIFMVKPSPFCMLDEVDHDLDEENVVRFLKLLKEFTDTTQFIIITHNRRTIEFADIIYGVTSEALGVSKVVSLELMEHAVE